MSLGERQVRRLLDEQMSERLPDPRAWLQKAHEFVSPRELLADMRLNDTLPLEDVCCTVMRGEWMLMAPAMLVRRTQVQVAMAAPFLDGNAPFEGGDDFRTWLERYALIGMLDGLDAEMEAELNGEPIVEEERSEYALFHELFGVDPSAARALMLRYSALPPRNRYILFETIVRGRQLSRVSKEVELAVPQAKAAFDSSLTDIGAIDGTPADFSAPWAEVLQMLMFGRGDDQ